MSLNGGKSNTVYQNEEAVTLPRHHWVVRGRVSFIVYWMNMTISLLSILSLGYQSASLYDQSAGCDRVDCLDSNRCRRSP